MESNGTTEGFKHKCQSWMKKPPGCLMSGVISVAIYHYLGEPPQLINPGSGPYSTAEQLRIAGRLQPRIWERLGQDNATGPTLGEVSALSAVLMGEKDQKI